MAKKKRARQAAAEAAAQAAAQQAAQQAAILKSNLSTDLSSNNAPVIADVPTATGTGVDGVTTVAGESTKKRRATGTLASQLGVNV